MTLIQFLFGFHGRIRRLHLWFYLLGVAVLHGGLMWQFGHILSVPHHYDMVMNSGVDMHMDHGAHFHFITHNPFVGLAGVILAWTHLAVFVKRWHDRDKSGWWMLINLIPVVGQIWTLIECGFLDGTQGPNRHGPSPKGIA